MNSILTYIAGLLAVLLFAALIGPSLVDWNQFRNGIETQASEVAGRPVSIDGDIRFRILPAPHLTLGKIKIGNDPEASSLPSEPHFATFDEIDAEVALAPLLSGDIKVTSVRIMRPQFNLEVLPDGSVNWKGLDFARRVPEEGMFSLASISLEKASFDNGSINYRNRVNGRKWTAEQVNGDIIATSLVGPLRSELEATVEGVPVLLRLGFGNFSGQKAFRVTAEVETRDYPAKFLFSGVATQFSMAARLDGNGRLEIGGDGQANEGEKAAPIRVDAGMVFNIRRASLRNLSVTTAGTTLTGTAEARWERRPVFSLTLSSESFTLDPLLDRMLASAGESADRERPPFLARLLSIPVPDWADGTAHVEAGTLMARGVLVREAVLDLSLQDSVLAVETARGELGGATRFAVSGELAANETGPSFDGTAEMTSGNISALAYWLSSISDVKDEGARAAPRGGSPFTAKAALRVTPQELSLRHLAAAYAPDISYRALRGDFAYRMTGARPYINAGMEIADFDFDPLIALLPESADPLAFLDSHDIDLSLNARRMAVRDTTLLDVDAKAVLASGKLTVSRLAIGDIEGVELSFSGVLDDVTTGERDDVKGNFTGTIRAERFGGLLELGGFDVPDVEGPVDLVLTGVSGEADDSQSRVDTLTLQGTVRGSRVDGVVKRRHEATGGIGSLDVIANAANDEGRILLEQLGLSPRGDLQGTGSASVQLRGGENGNYETNFRVNVSGTTLTARGQVENPFEALRFKGRADIAASGVMHVMGAFGAPQALAQWIGEQASAPGFVLSSDVEWDKKSLALNALESVAGNFRLAGNALWRSAEGDDGRPSVSGALEANAVDLTSLVVREGNEGDVWQVAALDWSPLGVFDGEIDLKADRVVLGRLAAGNAEAHVSVSHGVLTASPFTGTFAGGRVSIGARIEGGTGEPGIGLTVDVEGADLETAFNAAFGATPGGGRLDIDTQLQAQGRSWLALVSSASGIGTIGVSDAVFSPLDIVSFSRGLSELKSIDAFPTLVEERLGSGETTASDIGGDFAFAEGVLRFADDDVVLEGGKATISALYDMPRLVSEAELAVTLDEPEGAPSFAISAAGKVGYIDVENETLALQNFVARRILADSVKETGADVPRDLRDLMDLPQATAAPAVPMPRPSVTN
ncbi:MAG: AsmA family protein [Parvibaculum sp.]